MSCTMSIWPQVNKTSLLGTAYSLRGNNRRVKCSTCTTEVQTRLLNENNVSHSSIKNTWNCRMVCRVKGFVFLRYKEKNPFLFVTVFAVRLLTEFYNWVRLSGLAVRCRSNSCDPGLKKTKLPETSRLPSQVKDGKSINQWVNCEILHFMTRNPLDLDHVLNAYL